MKLNPNYALLSTPVSSDGPNHVNCGLILHKVRIGNLIEILTMNEIHTRQKDQKYVFQSSRYVYEGF